MEQINWHKATDDERATYVLKQVYKKHGLGDPDIGWDELLSLVANELAHRMGDKEFQRWLKINCPDYV